MTALIAAAPAALGDHRYVETQELLSRTLPGLALRFGRAVTDVDLDGASGLLGGGDCAPFDGAVHPGAPEVPDNGVDDNCVAGDTRASARVSAPPIVGALAPAPLSVVLLTIDTLRPDRTTAYDPAVATTPHLARWATGALRFERAYTAGMSTNVAIPPLLTGMYPRRLHWKRMWGSRALDTMRTRLGARAADIKNHGYTFPLDDEAPWLAERLAAREMHTAGVVDDGGTFLLRRETVGRGFAEFHEIGGDTVGATRDVETARTAVATLQRLAGVGRPFFLWVHVYGPHEPLPDASRAIGATAREYDRAILATDGALAPLFEALERVGAERPLATFVTADHGEALRSWTRGHGGDLFGGVPRVPLLVRAPGARVGSTELLTSLVDVVPTVLALTGTPAAGFDGADLSSVLHGRAQADTLRTRVLLADAWIAELQGPTFRSHVAGALDGRHALSLDIRYRGKSLFELPDEALPPRNRIAEIDPGRLEHALFAYLGEHRGRAGARLTPRDRSPRDGRRLRE